ncbi:1ce725ca-5ab4-4143-bbab-bdf7954128f3 [Thermothielavioides terrestris]|uniref:1ce725ca-5ab4-4143-bbab-bdf7954128f3 n=1 Tax=Thermothielavioides terrestris TaxID=2587410 RepID=A0A446BXD1_9PEZI|nr:1ce725ca-5ab4-4143-bbab-bdf7954128f3 [Thermothielavioides terrestris]
MQLTTLVLAALTSLASAQKTWVVAVAQNGSLTYSPNKLVAQPGEFVQFQFHAGNHTVTQSTFDQPCQPIAMHSNVTGFHSGFLPAAASASMGMLPTFTIEINNTNPLWIYCAQGKHCENGMVMVINEPTTNASRTLENFKALAAKGTTVVPGTSAAGEGGSTGSASSSATGSAASPSSSTAGAGMLAAPGPIALMAVAGVAMLL